jgi:hypothetical protein
MQQQGSVVQKSKDSSRRVQCSRKRGYDIQLVQVMRNGNIVWSGQTDEVIKNGTWQVNVRSFSWPLQTGRLAIGHPNGESVWRAT